MRILTHNIHTGYDVELAKTGHEFYATSLFKPWDPDLRPAPSNWHFIEKPDGQKFDLILISHAWELAGEYASIPAPMVFNIIADCSEGIFPPKIEERCSRICFLASEVAARWEMKDPSKKRVIEMGVDPSPFLPRKGDHEAGLTVGHRIGKRWDKGHCPFVTVERFVPLSLVGPGNEDIRGSVGTVTHANLMEMYSRYRVYFNPGPIIGISVAEAMMAGMPVVTFRPINLCNLVLDGVNGFVVDTVDGAVLRINSLLKDPERAWRMGRAAKEIAEERFSSARFVARWNTLFEQVRGEWCASHPAP